MYLKKYFGILFNIIIYDKIEYTKPTVKDTPEKIELTFGEYLNAFEKDFNEYKNTSQFRIAFSILINLQNLLLVVNRINAVIKYIDANKLYEQTLSYGNSLTKDELNKIYGILLLIENFNSITSFHDRFGSIRSIQRVIDQGEWTGLKVDRALLKNQQLIIEDLQNLSNDNLSIHEIINISKLLLQELKSFYNFNKLVKKKRE